MKKTISLQIDTNTGTIEFGSGRDIKGAMKKMHSIVSRNAALPWNNGRNAEEKGKIALEAARFYWSDLEPMRRDWESIRGSELGGLIGLEAADYADPASNLGTLSGTLVLQPTLPLYAYEYPELTGLFSDFSTETDLLNQSNDTRIVSVPAVEKYDPTLDANGRPKGFSVVSPAQTTDVPGAITDYIGVPLVIGQSTLSSTFRDIFKEMNEAAMKAIGGYWVGMVTKLLTVANFNSYAAVTAPDANGFVAVPVAYTTYARGINDWSMTDLDKLSAIFTKNKVPRKQRGILLAPDYYAKLRSDPRLEFFFAASQGNPVLTEQKLPDGLSGFFPYEAPYLPAANNLAFFPFHKAAICLKQRLPAKFQDVMPGVLIPGSVTPVVDPDTKLSVALVQRVDLQGNYAEYRPEVMLGAFLGDPRGGLCGTTQ